MAICRVCLNESDRLISLTVGDGAEQELQMLSQFMNPNVSRVVLDVQLLCPALSK